MIMEIKNLKKAANRILKAIKKRERIVLYGDADLDGAASVIILKESIQILGGEVAAVYFPDCEIEGYGISKTGLDCLRKFAPALFVVVDCGIGNFKETNLAKKLGFEIIIIDHHQVLGKLPNASIIVNPKQKGDKYPFKELATTGIVFKLSELLLGNQMRDSLRKNFLELTALATIADMMPNEQENKMFIEQGMASIKNSWRLGIQAFLKMEPFKGISNLSQKISKLVSILNIRDLQKGIPASFRLLTSLVEEESQNAIKKLLRKSEIKKTKISNATKEIEWQISKEIEPIIFMGSTKWEIGFIGALASIMCNKYKKPTFIFKKGVEESRGAVRALLGVNSVCLMEKCSKYLLVFGGHPRASGFRIKNKNLEKFKKCLIENL